MLEPSCPVSCIRLPVNQIRLLEPGLRKIIVGLADIKHRGCSINAQLAMVSGFPKTGTGNYYELWADMLMAIWRRLYPVFEHTTSGRVRLHFDCFELGACELAARISQRLAPTAETRASVSVLLKRLEIHRKRAKRSYVRLNGNTAYAYASKQWRDFVRWIRFHIVRKPSIRLDKPIDITRRPSMRRWDQRVIRWAMEAARRELTSRGEPVPTEDELHRLVRLAVGYVRRGRVGLSVRDLVSRPAGANYLAWFVLGRKRKAA